MILVFGSINLDLVASVDTLPAPGETVIGRRYHALPGGKGANQALAARRAGAQVAMVGCVGRDEFAAPALAELRRAGVELDATFGSDAPTGLAMIAVDRHGENQIVVAGGANALLTEGAVGDELLERADLLVLQREVAPRESRALARRARAHGVRVLLNTAPATGFLIDELEPVDVLITNEIELETVGDAAGVPTAEVSSRLATIAEATEVTAITTLGAAGALVVEGDTLRRFPVPRIDVVDTTGAGDAFVGSLAAVLDSGASIDDAVRFAVAAGSLACTELGAQAAAPTRERIEALLAEPV